MVCSTHDGPNPEAMAGARVTRHPGALRRLVHELARAPGASTASSPRWRICSPPTGTSGSTASASSRAPSPSPWSRRRTSTWTSRCPQVIEQKLAAVSLTDASTLRLRGAYAQREFIVQYKESDLAFVSRLAEHLGISFFFEHGDDGETMVFTDNPSGFLPAETAETSVFRPRGEERNVFSLTSRRRIVPSFYAVRDYNYRTPLVDITGETS